MRSQGRREGGNESVAKLGFIFPLYTPGSPRKGGKSSAQIRALNAARDSTAGIRCGFSKEPLTSRYASLQG